MGYKILALDQSSNLCGFCLMENGEIINKGVLNFSKLKEKGAAKYSIIKKQIDMIIKLTKAEVVVIEDTQQQVNANTYKILCELKGVLENLIYEKGFLYFVLSPSEWRSIVGIKGRKREDIKKECLKFIKDNFDLELLDNDDVAEAILMAYAVSIKYIPKIEVVIQEDLFS
jgi:Holliday junction resolvasome RuvABC endonuclease subunit